MKILFGSALISGLLLASSMAGAVTLVHSNDILGEVEPCGCRNNPLGGMARAYNLLGKLPDKERVLLDAGDLLFPTDVIPPLLQGQSKVQARYLLQSLDLLHEDAIVPGEKDFALGTRFLDELRKRSRIHFLAANLRKTDHTRPFERHLILRKRTADGKTLKVAIFGIVGEKIAWPRGLKASPAIPAARREVRDLRRQADVLIALTHEGLDQDRELAQAVPGIDIIVGGHSQSFIQEPITVGSTHIYQSSFRNQYLGLVPLTRPFTGANYQLVGLDAGYDSPVGAPSPMDDLVSRFKKAIAEFNAREDATLMAEAASQRDPAAVTKFQTFPRCAECHLKQFDFWRKTRHAEALAALIDKQQDQNKECLGCHTVGLGDPHGFNSVTQLAETRKDDGSTIDPLATADLASFLKFIHSAPSLDSTSKVRSTDAQALPLRQSLNLIHQAWAPVQCENCHQPGRDHPFGATYAKVVETSTCLACHTPERAPGWYARDGKPDPQVVAAKRALVTCPVGD